MTNQQHVQDKNTNGRVGQKDAAPPQKHSMWGITFIMLGAFTASLMFLVVKLLADDANTFTLLFYRGLAQVVLSLLTLAHEGNNKPILGSREVRGWLVLRATLGAAAVCAWFYGAQVLPLSDAVTLQFTTPPFAAAFAVCLVGEPWLPIDMVGAVVCLTGVALIAHPTWLFSTTTTTEQQDHDVDSMSQVIAVLITTAGAALAGLAYVCVRAIGDRASAVVMVFYYGAVSMPVAVIGSLVWQGTCNVFCVRGGITSAVLVLLIGVLGHAAQWFLNLGLQLETAATATLATCTQIVWTYIFELAFLHEELDRWSLGGSGLILSYMVVVAVHKMKSVATTDDTSIDEEKAVSEDTPLLEATSETTS